MFVVLRVILVVGLGVDAKRSGIRLLTDAVLILLFVVGLWGLGGTSSVFMAGRGD